MYAWLADAIRASKFEAARRRRELAALPQVASESTGPALTGNKRSRFDSNDFDNALTASASKRRRPAQSLDADAAASPLSLSEEGALLHYFELDIQRTCAAIPFDRAIMATAIVFFKRFYLSAAPTEYPPGDIMYDDRIVKVCCFKLGDSTITCMSCTRISRAGLQGCGLVPGH